jgi:osmotically-inducible protein OsmY
VVLVLNPSSFLIKGLLLMISSSALLDRTHEPTADEQLARRISNFLRSKDLLAGTRLRVDVAGGVVTLRGSARSFYQKQLWLHGAQRVAGVIEIVDHIEVQST